MREHKGKERERERENDIPIERERERATGKETPNGVDQYDGAKKTKTP